MRWSSLDGQRWQQLEKQCWDALESARSEDDRPRQLWMREVLRSGLERLTPRQRQVLSLLYGEELSPVQAAGRLAVDPSTVRCTAGRALSRLRTHAEARTLAESMRQADGSVDLRALAERTDLLTPRQRQVLLLSLEGLSVGAIAEKLAVDRTTVGRTLRRGRARLAQAAGELPDRDTLLCTLAGEGRMSCKELSRQFGLSLWAVYRRTAEVRNSGGLTPLQSEVWTRSRMGEGSSEIAERLGMSAANVRRARRRAEKRLQERRCLPTDHTSKANVSGT